MTFTSKSDDLPIRETILGIIKSKDKLGKSVIHSSDFRNAVMDLGFSMGMPVIENMLIYCKIDATGNLDYSDLERELVRERRIYNASAKNDQLPVSTSQGVAPKPWRPDEFHQSRVLTERQSQLLAEFGPQVKEIYEELSNHRISSQQASNFLKNLGIFLTKECLKNLQEMEYNPVSYSAFIRSLTKFVPVRDDLEDKEVAAGAYLVRPSLTGETIGSQRKRATGLQTAFHESAQQDHSQRTYRKMVTDQKINDQVIFKNKEIKNILFFDDSNATISLLSHNQEDMVRGPSGEKKVDVNYNIDQRLQREQLCAALKKLDTGVISMDDFQDLVFSIGIDIPENFLSDIRRDVVAGQLDVRKYLKKLDSNIFKFASIDNYLHDNTTKLSIQKFRRNLLALGFESFQNLALIFKTIDSNQDGKLTFAEFKDGTKQLLKQSLSENELRSIFHSFDKNGDGFLQYEEFVDCIRGELNPSRKQIVRKAFKKLDRHCTGDVPLDYAGEAFNAAGHPQVVNGEKSPSQVTTEFLKWFCTQGSSNGVITFEKFLQYFANLSTFVEEEEEFASIVSAMWNLSDQAPPPPMLKVKRGKEVVTPKAVQHHGDLITWQQEESNIETMEKYFESSKGKKNHPAETRKNFQSDVIRWSNHHIPTKNNTESVVDELRVLGVDSIATGRKNANSQQNLLEWSIKNKQQQPKSPAPIHTIPELKLPYQEEFPMAGTPTHRQKVKETFTPTKNKMKEYYSLVKPFGVDEETSNDLQRSSTNFVGAKSLSEVLKSKPNTPKSLAEYLEK